jgi:hypothetical protein
VARLQKIGPKLTLDLDGPKIPADRFRAAVNAFVALVEDVSREVEGGTRTVRWLITVERGSIHLSASPEATKPHAKLKQITHAIRSGVMLIERRAERPRYFTDSALQHARDLADTVDGRDVARAQIRLARKRLTLTKRITANVDTILGVHVKDYGTLEGRLLVVSAQGGPSIAVVDPLTERGVRCFISEAQLGQALMAFRKRVAVSGTIRYRRDGHPNSIEVEDLIVFADNSELPTAEEVHGILSKTE